MKLEDIEALVRKRMVAIDEEVGAEGGHPVCTMLIMSTDQGIAFVSITPSRQHSVSLLREAIRRLECDA